MGRSSASGAPDKRSSHGVMTSSSPCASSAARWPRANSPYWSVGLPSPLGAICDFVGMEIDAVGADEAAALALGGREEKLFQTGEIVVDLAPGKLEDLVDEKARPVALLGELGGVRAVRRGLALVAVVAFDRTLPARVPRWNHRPRLIRPARLGDR